MDLGGVINDGREGARILVPLHQPCLLGLCVLIPRVSAPGELGTGGADENEKGLASPSSLHPFPLVPHLVSPPPPPSPGSNLPHIPLGFSRHQGPPPSFITPLRPTGSAKAAWGFPQKPPQDRMLCTPGSIRKHPGPSDRDPGSVYCLRSHFVEATWLFFYLLSICSAGSFIRAFTPQYFGSWGLSLMLQIQEHFRLSARRALQAHGLLRMKALRGGVCMPPCRIPRPPAHGSL